MISLLLTLLVLGLLAYWMLHGIVGGHGKDRQGAGGMAVQINCERALSSFVQRTGGVGPAAQAAYDALPPQCRKMMPDPAALAAPADPDNGN
jgi:hypothetical protein